MNMTLLQRKPFVTDSRRSVEVRVYDDGARYLVAGYEGETQITVTYEVDGIKDDPLVTMLGFCPYEGLVGLVIRDIKKGWLVVGTPEHPFGGKAPALAAVA